jgi:hypothetical protein
MTLLIIGIVTGLAGIVLLAWYPIGDALAKRQARRIMGDLKIRRDK